MRTFVYIATPKRSIYLHLLKYKQSHYPLSNKITYLISTSFYVLFSHWNEYFACSEAHSKHIELAKCAHVVRRHETWQLSKMSFRRKIRSSFGIQRALLSSNVFLMGNVRARLSRHLSTESTDDSNVYYSYIEHFKWHFTCKCIHFDLSLLRNLSVRSSCQ